MKIFEQSIGFEHTKTSFSLSTAWKKVGLRFHTVHCELIFLQFFSSSPFFSFFFIILGDNPAAMYHEHRGGAQYVHATNYCVHGLAIFYVVTFIRYCIEFVRCT